MLISKNKLLVCILVRLKLLDRFTKDELGRVTFTQEEPKAPVTVFVHLENVPEGMETKW